MRPAGDSANDVGEAAKAELGRRIVDVALLRGEFVLSSGEKSGFYFDKYLFETRPELLSRVADFLAERVPEGVDVLAGPELGGVALATALSLRTGLPFVIVRKRSKGYGTGHLIEGRLAPADRVLIVEDVVSTGAESIRSARTVAECGATVVGVLAVLDREQGGARNVADAGFAFDAVYRRGELAM
ncbi:orotate phosphoribosyltransferase [Streptomyces sp. NPDC087270]|uniref:orotate phosphoribosyltransferase n=1 Tax=Streptomyces sp. NPDC087270 TaxID=3365774 RepID=UPI003817C761